MTNSKRSPRGGAASRSLFPRPANGHRGPETQDADNRPNLRSVDDRCADPHPSWLTTWRRLRAGLGSDGAAGQSREAVQELQDKIANTPAETLAGLQAQAELIAELAWNDLVAKTAHQLIAGLKRVRRSELG